MRVRWLACKVGRHITDIIIAYVIVLIQYNGEMSTWMLAKVILAIKLNVFALPLIGTNVFHAVTMWMWYVIAIIWIAQFVHLMDYSAKEIIDEIEEDLVKLYKKLNRSNEQVDEQS